MAGPASDHERHATTEAQIAQLRAELAAWRAADAVLADALTHLRTQVILAPVEWDAHRETAWIWGILVGLGCDRPHLHDRLCHADLRQVADRHLWGRGAVARLHTWRRAVAAVTSARG
jgi:hypothetical protein